MKLSRRQFLTLSAMAGAGLAVPAKWLSTPTPVKAFSGSDSLKLFVQPLRGLGGIPVAAADTDKQPWWQKGVTHYTMDIRQYEDQLHPDLPPTRLWGYGQGPATNFRHLGGIIAAKRGTPVQLTFRNNLPPDPIVPVDESIMGVMGNQMNRACVHLHGGLVPWTSDGGPYSWWDPEGHHGETFLNNQVLRPGQKVPANEAEYYYPNNQSSRMMWYHDHSLGITRTNAYSGIASGYVIYDDYELLLGKLGNLPGPLDPRTLYLIFQDKIFVSNDIEQRDPTWMKLMPNSRHGDLWYPHEYDPNRWELVAPANPPDVSCVPEFFGDTILVNGTVHPFVEVEQRQYRLRMLNACGARFLNPRLVYARGAGFPDNAVAMPDRPGPGFVQFGSEGGFSPYPVLVNYKNTPALTLAPAERADLIVDFRNVPAGSFLILYADAPAPYPMGDDMNDYPNPTIPPQEGFGPNTRTLLQIRVKARSGAADKPILLPPLLTPTDPFLVRQIPGIPTKVPNRAKVRRVTLNEIHDEFGRLIQMLGSDQATGTDPVTGMPTFARAYMDSPTEVIERGALEVWEIVNLTGDTHPIHFHLVNVQLLSRQAFNPDTYMGGAPDYTDGLIAPEFNELGWKETVRVNPGEVARVLMKFDLPVMPFKVPVSPRTGGHEYVWHCHILEHEEHDMMRPLVVK